MAQQFQMKIKLKLKRAINSITHLNSHETVPLRRHHTIFQIFLSKYLSCENNKYFESCLHKPIRLRLHQFSKPSELK